MIFLEMSVISWSEDKRKSMLYEYYILYYYYNIIIHLTGILNFFFRERVARSRIISTVPATSISLNIYFIQ